MFSFSASGGSLRWNMRYCHDLDCHDLDCHDLDCHDLDCHDLDWHDLDWHDLDWHDQECHDPDCYQLARGDCEPQSGPGLRLCWSGGGIQWRGCFRDKGAT